MPARRRRRRESAILHRIHSSRAASLTSPAASALVAARAPRRGQATHSDPARSDAAVPCQYTRAATWRPRIRLHGTTHTVRVNHAKCARKQVVARARWAGCTTAGGGSEGLRLRQGREAPAGRGDLRRSARQRRISRGDAARWRRAGATGRQWQGAHLCEGDGLLSVRGEAAVPGLRRGEQVVVAAAVVGTRET
jgi:hypothetical protein